MVIKTPLTQEQLLRAATMLARREVEVLRHTIAGIRDLDDEEAMRADVWAALQGVFFLMYAYEGQDRYLTMKQMYRLMPGKHLETQRKWVYRCERQGYLKIEKNLEDGRSMILRLSDGAKAKTEMEMQAMAHDWETILDAGGRENER